MDIYIVNIDYDTPFNRFVESEESIVNSCVKKLRKPGMGNVAFIVRHNHSFHIASRVTDLQSELRVMREDWQRRQRESGA